MFVPEPATSYFPREGSYEQLPARFTGPISTFASKSPMLCCENAVPMSKLANTSANQDLVKLISQLSAKCLVVVALRMGFVPPPSAFDNFPNRVLSLPTKFAFGSRGIGDERWRIAFAPSHLSHRDRVARDFAAQRDNFLDA